MRWLLAACLSLTAFSASAQDYRPHEIAGKFVELETAILGTQAATAQGFAEVKAALAETSGGFDAVELELAKIGAGFDLIADGFAQIEDELTGINGDIAATAALGALTYASQDGWQVSVAGATTTRHGVPAGAVGIAYRKGSVMGQIGVAMPATGADPVIAGSITINLN